MNPVAVNWNRRESVTVQGRTKAGRSYPAGSIALMAAPVIPTAPSGRFCDTGPRGCVRAVPAAPGRGCPRMVPEPAPRAHLRGRPRSCRCSIRGASVLTIRYPSVCSRAACWLYNSARFCRALAEGLHLRSRRVDGDRARRMGCSPPPAARKRIASPMAITRKTGRAAAGMGGRRHYTGHAGPVRAFADNRAFAASILASCSKGSRRFVAASCAVRRALYYLAPLLAPLDNEQIFGWRVLCIPFYRAAARAEAVAARAMRLLALRAWRELHSPGARGQHRPCWSCSSGCSSGRRCWWALPVAGLLPAAAGGDGAGRARAVPPAPVAAVAGHAARGHGRGARGCCAPAACRGETWLVALGYTVYFVARRRMRTDHLGGHWLVMLLVPGAVVRAARALVTLPLVALTRTCGRWCRHWAW